MLRFFRTIRRRLLDSGSLRKYFVYAIGEILLVVIGILIALQINNWNEGRKDKNKELQILQAIQSNLKEDAANLIKAKERYFLTQKYIERFFQDSPIPDDSIGYISTRMAGHAPFIPNTTAFTLSVSSGKLDLIRDKNLVQQIQRLYAFEYLVVIESHKELDKQMDRMKDLTTKYEALEIKPIERSGGFYDQSFVLPWNIENLKRRNQSVELRAIVRHLHVSVGQTLRFYDQVAQKNKALLKDIEDYVNSNF